MQRVYLVGRPGEVGGAATKLADLIDLLDTTIEFVVISMPGMQLTKKESIRIQKAYKIRVADWKELDLDREAVVLAVCEKAFFSSGAAARIKDRGTRIVWSNEMMWPFDGEADAVNAGVVDRVLLVSQHQKEAFANIYNEVESCLTGNFVSPERFPFRVRENPIFTIGRLSRPDPDKYPANFPVFYEALGLTEARFRVMAWDEKLKKRYAWHKFGRSWEVLPANREEANAFLGSLDLFVYPLGHKVKESWGRAVVEAMLTGCVPVVPKGHNFNNFVTHGESGYVCGPFEEYKEAVLEMSENYSSRKRMAKQASEAAREKICAREQHRKIWQEALTF